MRAHTHAHAVAERGLCSGCQHAQAEAQHRTTAAGRIGQRRTVQPCAATHVDEAGGQAVLDQRAGEGHAAGVIESYGVIDEVANLRGEPVGGFVDQQATPACAGIERQVEAHRRALDAGYAEAVPVRSLRIEKATGRLKRGRQFGGKDITRRRRHHEPVGAGRDHRESVAAVGAGDHARGRRRRAVGQQHAGRTAGIAAIAAARHIDELHRGARQRLVGTLVVDHAGGVDQQGGGGRDRHGATAAHGGRHHVVWQHFQDAVARNDRAARGAGRGHIRLNAEQAGVGTGLDRGEDFDIPGEAADERDRRRERARGIGVARRGIHLHEHRTTGQSRSTRCRITRAGEVGDARRAHGQLHHDRVARGALEAPLRCAGPGAGCRSGERATRVAVHGDAQLTGQSGCGRQGGERPGDRIHARARWSGRNVSVRRRSEHMVEELRAGAQGLSAHKARVGRYLKAEQEQAGARAIDGDRNRVGGRAAAVCRTRREVEARSRSA